MNFFQVSHFSVTLFVRFTTHVHRKRVILGRNFSLLFHRLIFVKGLARLNYHPVERHIFVLCSHSFLYWVKEVFVEFLLCFEVSLCLVPAFFGLLQLDLKLFVLFFDLVECVSSCFIFLFLLLHTLSTIQHQVDFLWHSPVSLSLVHGQEVEVDMETFIFP